MLISDSNFPEKKRSIELEKKEEERRGEERKGQITLTLSFSSKRKVYSVSFSVEEMREKEGKRERK
jgi:hypothetical protein